MSSVLENKGYRCVYFLAALYMSLMTCSAVLGNKLIETSFGVLSAASLVSPLWFILGDVITEVYGLKIIMRLFWSVVTCQFIFAIICFFLINFKSPVFWGGQEGYELVLGHLVRIAVFQFFGVTLAWNLNARLLSRWKKLMLGRYFWLRSIGSSGIGLVIFSCVSVFPSIYGMFPLKIVISMVMWSCILKMIFIVLLAFPSTMTVFLLKKMENINSDYQEIKYDPFGAVQI